MGWHTADASWWPVISEMLTGKWPREAALMDLRWYGDRKHLTGKRIPPRAFFAKRWGWTDKPTRSLVASFEWWDEKWSDEASAAWGPAAAAERSRARNPRANPGLKKGQERANPGPIEGQSGANRGPDPTSSNANNATGKGQSRANPGLIEGQSGAKKGPRKGQERSTRAKETHTPSPPQAPPPTQHKAEVSPSATASAEQDLFGSGGLVQGDPPPALPALKKSFTSADKRKAAQRIYDAWRAHHLDEPESPLSSDSGKIVARLTDLARQAKGKRPRYAPEDWATAEQDLLDLVEWYHFAPRATWWREQDRLGVGTMFKRTNFGDRHRDLIKWRNSGRSTDAAPSTARKGANAHVFGAPPQERDWIEAEVIESNSTPQGGPHGQ